MKTCSVDGCNGIYKAKGLCRTHYSRLLIHGDPSINLRAKNELCSIVDCESKPKSRGWCDKHYSRWLRHGNPLLIIKNITPLFATIEETFLNNFETKGNDECWDWKGKSIKAGYGRLHFKSKYYSAHRFSYEYFIEKIPKDLWVLHKCDRPVCINPSHLFLGTVQDNNADCVKKGRHKTYPNAIKPKGEMHKNAKLTDRNVKEIKYLIKKGYLDAEISSLFKITVSAINHIRNGRTWKHI